MNNLTIGITHWPKTENRTKYLGQCLLYLYNNFCDISNIQVVVSIIPGLFIEESKKILEKYKTVNIFSDVHLYGGEHIDVLKDNCDTKYFLLLQDDWILIRSFDYERILEFMDTYPDVIMVQLCIDYLLHKTECKHFILNNYENWNDIYQISYDCSVFYNDHPSIHSKILRDVVGKYPNVQDTSWEWRYSKQCRIKCKEYNLKSVFVDYNNKSVWRHIGGESSQVRLRLDKEI